MIESFAIATLSGLVLWSTGNLANVAQIINKFIQDVLVQEQRIKDVYTEKSHNVKWTIENDLDLIFIAIYQETSFSSMVGRLLETVRSRFLERINKRVPAFLPLFDFTEDFDELMAQIDFAETVCDLLSEFLIYNNFSFFLLFVSIIFLSLHTGFKTCPCTSRDL